MSKEPGIELTTDEKLVILMEECAEVIKAASKCLRFGFDRSQPGYGQNDLVLAAEIGDMLGMVDSLPLDAAQIAHFRANKLAKAEKAKAEFGVKK
jgi:hypothetical protein